MLGYKVTDAKRSRICGVACKSFQELKKKGCQKLQVDIKTVTIRLQDGTFVEDDDYFKLLPPQTLFLFVASDENVLTGYEIFYHMLCSVHKDYLTVGKLASDFLSQDLKSKVREFATVLEKQDMKSRSKLSTCKEDPDWFKDLDTNCQTKEDFMHKRSQDRIRGYLCKTQDSIKQSSEYKTDTKVRKKLDTVLNSWKTWLKTLSYFGCYFNRNCSQGPEILSSFCDSTGTFYCQGAWNKEDCLHINANMYNHLINPYESRETRIIFSTWNLDHRIERSRQIGPALLTAATSAVHQNEEVDALYFFTLLFTRKNLKLVHIVCHDKAEHTGAKCTEGRFTTRKLISSTSVDNLIQAL